MRGTTRELGVKETERPAANELAEGLEPTVGADPMMPSATGEAMPPFRFQSLGSSMLLLAGATMISKAVSFFMLPLYTHYLTPADYGSIELIEQTLDVISIVAGSRLLGGVFRFYYKAKTEDERSAVISTSIWTVCLGYAVIALLAFAAAPFISRVVLGSDRYTGLVRLAALALATTAPTFVPTPFFRARGRFRLIAGAQLVRLAIQVTANVVLLTVVHAGAKSMFLSTLIANVCLGSVLSVMAFRQVGLHYSRRVAGDLYRFGVPLMATQAATFILTFGDRYFLRATATLGVVGLYGLAYQFAFLLALLAQTPIDMVWDPKRHEVAKRLDRDTIYSRMFVYLNVVLMSAAVGISLFVHIILQVMTPVAFWPAAHVVPVLLVAIVLQAWTSSQDIGILVTERTKWIAIANWIGAGVVLAAYAVLVPRFAAWGAAIATVIGYAVRYAAIYTVSQRLWPVRYNWRPVLRLAALAIVTVLVGTTFPYGPLALAIGTRIALYILYVAIVWRSRILTDHDRRTVRQGVARLFEMLAGRLRLAGEFPRGAS